MSMPRRGRHRRLQPFSAKYVTGGSRQLTYSSSTGKKTIVQKNIVRFGLWADDWNRRFAFAFAWVCVWLILFALGCYLAVEVVTWLRTMG